jgi:dCMP deaminase
VRYSDRNTKLKFIAHAEANAIAQAARVGAKLLGSTLIVTALYPCSNCAKLIIQAGVKKVYAPSMNVEITNATWFEEAAIATQLFKEAGVEIEEYEHE